LINRRIYPANILTLLLDCSLRYHNLKEPKTAYNQAESLIGMCMDNRKYLNIPDNFSYTIRAGGANLKFSEFNVSYAISVGQIHHIAIIDHNKSDMVKNVG